MLSKTSPKRPRPRSQAELGLRRLAALPKLKHTAQAGSECRSKRGSPSQKSTRPPLRSQRVQIINAVARMPASRRRQLRPRLRGLGRAALPHSQKIRCLRATRRAGLVWSAVASAITRASGELRAAPGNTTSSHAFHPMVPGRLRRAPKETPPTLRRLRSEFTLRFLWNLHLLSRCPCQPSSSAPPSARA